jgi:microtubule-associated protein-like 6
MKNDEEFVTVGVRHFKLWKYKSGVLSNKNGKFKRGKYSNMIVNCTAYKNYCITGTLKGEVLVWNGTSVTKCVKGQHEGPVDAIHVYKDLIFTGGRQGNIAILDEKFNVIHKVSTSKLGGADPGVNAFAYDGSRLVIGTRGSEVYELNFSITSSDISIQNEITAGHFAP